ncbi:MAG TPA: hypothetical protein VMU50_17235 [Polyangia bacterium]|nr:hypothetical protein [Polyangia bacterium]
MALRPPVLAAAATAAAAACCLCLGGAGCGQNGSAPPVAPAALRSFEVEATFDWQPRSPGDAPNNLPGAQRFTLTLDSRTPGQENVIVGGYGLVAVVPVTADASGHVAYRNQDSGLLDQQRTTLQVALPPLPASPCYGAINVSYGALDLDISAAGVTGVGSGFAEYVDGDALGTVGFVASFTGGVDTRGPTPSLPGASPINFHPMDAMTIDVSEALAADASLALGDGTASFPMDAAPKDFPSRFTTQSKLLPFGRRWQLVTAGFRDLAGNVAASPALEVVTPDLPGPFAGFATTPPAALMSGHVRVADRASIPALGDGRALVFDTSETDWSGGRFTARLPLPAGATEVVMRARSLSGDNISSPWLTASLAVSGGAITANSVELFHGSDVNTPSGVADLPEISPAYDYPLPLPAGASGEVIVDLSSLSGSNCGPILRPGISVIDAITAR